MLKIQKDASIQMHYDTFLKKHDIKREVHRQENWKKTHGTAENKKKSDKKYRNINLTLIICIQ